MSILGDRIFGVELAKHLDRERKMSEWKDISTAPKDGRWVLIYGGKAVHDTQDGLSARFECDNNCVMCGFMNLSGVWEGDADNWTYTPTHWMPLPKPPKGAA